MNDKTLSNAELELTQKIQMHFPRGVILQDILQEWNGLKSEILTSKLIGLFSKTPFNISISRAKPFDPVKFISEGWSIKEQDERALKISGIDLNDLQFTNYLKAGETAIKGEERLKRAKKDSRVRLDAGLFMSFYLEKNHTALEWLRINKGITHIVFDGTILQNPRSLRFVLDLDWRGGRWDWDCSWLENGFRTRDLSALLASKN